MKIRYKNFTTTAYLAQLEELYHWFLSKEDLEVRTSGTTGEPKIIKLNRKHVLNSAQMSIDFFQINQSSKVLLCLPLNRIGGIMLAIRCFLAKAEIIPMDPSLDLLSKLEGYPIIDFASMVPNQLEANIELLNRVKSVLVGGGPLHSELEERLSHHKTNVWHSYASTETISHIALRQVHPHGTENYVALDGISFSQGEDGNLIINCASLGLNQLQTNDLVKLISEKEFVWLGRIDNVVLSGGFKLYPEKIEAKLRLNVPFFLDKDEDPALGERLILVCLEQSNLTYVLESLQQQLEGANRPKAIYTAKEFNYTPNGKLKRAETREGAKFWSLV